MDRIRTVTTIVLDGKRKEGYVKVHFQRGMYRLTPINNVDYRTQEERNRLLRKLELVISIQNQGDTSYWLWSKHGTYRVASCYNIVTYRVKRDNIAEEILNLKSK